MPKTELRRSINFERTGRYVLMVHGSPSAYQTYRCRCKTCTRSNRARAAAWRRSQSVPERRVGRDPEKVYRRRRRPAQPKPVPMTAHSWVGLVLELYEGEWFNWYRLQLEVELRLERPVSLDAIRQACWRLRRAGMAKRRLTTSGQAEWSWAC